MDCSPPGSSIHGISHARILEWVAFSSPGDLPDPGIKPMSPALQADSLPLSHQGRLLEYRNQSWTRKTCILAQAVITEYYRLGALNNNVVVVQSLSCVWLVATPHTLQQARLLCPSLSPWVCSNSHPLSWWCHPTISFSVALFSSCLQSFPASESFTEEQIFLIIYLDVKY